MVLLRTAPVSVASKIFFCLDLVIVSTVDDSFENLVWHHNARACLLQHELTKFFRRLLFSKLIQSKHKSNIACLRLVGLNGISARLLLGSSLYVRECEISEGVGVTKLAADSGRTNETAFATRRKVRVTLEVIGG